VETIKNTKKKSGVSKTSKSEALFVDAQKHLVGGVNSPVRSFGAVGGTPRFIDRADGAFITDVDGNSYVDFVGSWGPMILGHNPKPVQAALKKVIEKGTSFGAPTSVEVELAGLVKDAYPTIDRIRFTSSGTEATMSAIRLARAVTNRERILKFEGGYHGHSDSLLVAAGSGATTFGVPSSAGVPALLARNTWVLPYNDIAAVEDIFYTQGPNIAAVIVEPVCGNMGVVAPQSGFLEKLRSLTKKHGAMLIFDEVITGFRLAWGGAQEMFGVEADITCLGKIIGGGFPVGAFGASEKIMNMVAPLGPMYQAGTLSGNPVAMTAGLVTLKMLQTKKPYENLEKKTATLCEFIRSAAKKKKVSVVVNQVGSMFTVFFTDQPVINYFSAMLADRKKYATFFHALLNKNVYFPPAQFEAAFVSTLHDNAVMETAQQAFSAALDEVSKIK
jgi:glutamate-1-semialdehyde 2,1-aminomutase